MDCLATYSTIHAVGTPTAAPLYRIELHMTMLVPRINKVNVPAPTILWPCCKTERGARDRELYLQTSPHLFPHLVPLSELLLFTAQNSRHKRVSACQNLSHVSNVTHVTHGTKKLSANWRQHTYNNSNSKCAVSFAAAAAAAAAASA